MQVGDVFFTIRFEGKKIAPLITFREVSCVS